MLRKLIRKIKRRLIALKYKKIKNLSEDERLAYHVKQVWNLMDKDLESLKGCRSIFMYERDKEYYLSCVSEDGKVCSIRIPKEEAVLPIEREIY